MNESDTNCFKPYRHNMPIFDEKKNVTDRVYSALDNVLRVYRDFARLHSEKTDNNFNNYKISRIYVVGSGALENKVDSDLDIMLITPRLDEHSANDIIILLSYLFFNNKPKNEAIDVYVRPKDKFPSRASIDITNQVESYLEKYDLKL